MHDHWFVKLRIANEATATEWPLASGTQIQGALKSCAERFPQHPHFATTSEATVSVRAPSSTPYSIVHRLIQEMARSGIYRIGFDVIAPRGDASDRRMDVPLPFDVTKGLAPVGIRVSLRRDPATGALARKREDWLEQIYDPGGGGIRRQRVPAQSFPCTEAGDAQLRSFVKQWLVEADKTEHGRVSAVVDAAGDVTLQDAIRLIDGFRAGGIELIEFPAELLK